MELSCVSVSLVTSQVFGQEVQLQDLLVLDQQTHQRPQSGLGTRHRRGRPNLSDDKPHRQCGRRQQGRRCCDGNRWKSRSEPGRRDEPEGEKVDLDRRQRNWIQAANLLFGSQVIYRSL